ncbi:hypothetical protein B7463_g7482, partial [Scytalidium lignicola]
MASDPTTTVRVPKAVSTYSTTTQDPDLRSQINTVLLREGHVAKIQETLLHALNANPTNWPTLIQDHALELLRSGQCTTFPTLMERVLADVRRDTEESREKEAAEIGDATGKSNSNGSGGGGGGEGKLALPKNVVEEGVRITRECLEQVCEIVE